MLLLLAHHHDAEARWLQQMLDQVYHLRMAYLVPEALGLDYNITLRLNNHGQPSATVAFNKAAWKLESNEVSYAINRLSYVDPIIGRKAQPSELTYAASELNAFFPALIASLPCPVSNRIYHGALYGDVNFAARWAARVDECGLSFDSSFIDDPSSSYQKLSAINPTELHRFMFDGEEILTPPDQATLPRENEIRECFINQGEDETLEAIFMNESGTPRLLYLSKTPSLSCYGALYLDSLAQRLVKHKYDPAHRHSQRTAVAAAG